MAFVTKWVLYRRTIIFTQVNRIYFGFFEWIGMDISIFNIPKFLKKFNNALILVFLIVVGHLGGNLTHGESYLFEYAPEPIKTVLISETKQKNLKRYH